MAPDVLTDSVELALTRVRRGELSRRTFLEGLAVLGLGGLVAPTLCAPRPAAAQAKPKEIVMASSRSRPSGTGTTRSRRSAGTST